MGGRVVTHCARGSKVAGSTTPRRPATLPPRHPPSRIDVADGDGAAIRRRLTAASTAAALSFAPTRFRLVATSGVTDRAAAIGTHVDRARPFPLAVLFDRNLTLSRPAAFTVAATAGLPWFRRDPNPATGTRFSSPLLITCRAAALGILLGSRLPVAARLPVAISRPVVICSLFRRNAISLVGSVNGGLGNRRKLPTIISRQERQAHVARIITQLDALPAAPDIDPIDVSPPPAIAGNRDLDHASPSRQPAYFAQASLQTEIEPEPRLTRIGVWRPDGFGVVIVGGNRRGLIVRPAAAHDLQLRLLRRCVRVAAGGPTVERVTIEGVAENRVSLGRIAIERIVRLRFGSDRRSAGRAVS
jgi:hypothetical protein